MQEKGAVEFFNSLYESTPKSHFVAAKALSREVTQRISGLCES